MDQSLDEIIQAKRKTNKNFNRQRPRTNNNNNAPVRRGRITKRNSAPVMFTKPTNEQWKHDMFRGNRSGHKIMISNLDFGVNNEDINELFKEFGAVTRAGVNYDRSGRSLGTAEVVYVNKTSAIQARNKYNGIPLDNKPMKIAIIDSSVSAFNRVGNIQTRNNSVPQRTVNNGNNFRPRSNPNANRRNNNNRGGGNNNRQQKAMKTKEQLDAEMDEFLSKVARSKIP